MATESQIVQAWRNKARILRERHAHQFPEQTRIAIHVLQTCIEELEYRDEYVYLEPGDSAFAPFAPSRDNPPPSLPSLPSVK